MRVKQNTYISEMGSSAFWFKTNVTFDENNAHSDAAQHLRQLIKTI